MRGLLLVAASGLAREVLVIERLLGRFASVLVIDDDPRSWGTALDGAPVIGGSDLVREYDDHLLLVCTGRGRRAIVDRLARLGVEPDRYATTVHPDVRVPPGSTVAPGSILMAGVTLTADVAVGAHVVAMPQVTLTHDVVVEDHATLCAGVALGGGVRVRSGAYLGMGCCVRERLTIGRDAVVGMGAAVVEDVPDEETWVGVPARPVASVRRVR